MTPRPYPREALRSAIVEARNGSRFALTWITFKLRGKRYCARNIARWGHTPTGRFLADENRKTPA